MKDNDLGKLALVNPSNRDSVSHWAELSARQRHKVREIVSDLELGSWEPEHETYFTFHKLLRGNGLADYPIIRQMLEAQRSYSIAFRNDLMASRSAKTLLSDTEGSWHRELAEISEEGLRKAYCNLVGYSILLKGQLAALEELELVSMWYERLSGAADRARWLADRIAKVSRYVFKRLEPWQIGEIKKKERQPHNSPVTLTNGDACMRLCSDGVALDDLLARTAAWPDVFRLDALKTEVNDYVAFANNNELTFPPPQKVEGKKTEAEKTLKDAYKSHMIKMVKLALENPHMGKGEILRAVAEETMIPIGTCKSWFDGHLGTANGGGYETKTNKAEAIAKLLDQVKGR